MDLGGQGPNVMMGLVGKAGLVEGSEVFFDNLFTLFPLLRALSDLGIAGTGTVRANRMFRVPLTTKKDMDKKEIPRGTIEAVYRSDQVLMDQYWTGTIVPYLHYRTRSVLHYCTRYFVRYYST